MSANVTLPAIKVLAKRTLPRRIWDGLRVATGRAVAAEVRPAIPPGPGDNLYEALYEAHAQALSGEEAVGGGDFHLIGGIELGALLMAGLRPNDTVVDFGCGTGRLARQLIPRLAGGHYIGIDIAPTMLVRAEHRVRSTIPQAPCQVTWIRQDTTTFPLRAESVDMICAFSVFTHIEHEDTYRYLKDAARIVRPGGRFVFSCLPMDLVAAQHIFLQSAGNDFRERWRQVRNVTTSVDLMTAIAQLAGWTPTHWYAGDRPTIQLPETGEFHGLGQSICVLAKSLSTP